MGWMRVDQNSLAVPMEHRVSVVLKFYNLTTYFEKEDSEVHNWTRIPQPQNFLMVKNNSKMVERMNCEFETLDECQWKIVLNKILRKVWQITFSSEWYSNSTSFQSITLLDFLYPISTLRLIIVLNIVWGRGTYIWYRTS